MKLCNNPTRRLQRRKGALKRFPPYLSKERGGKRLVAQWEVELARLTELCSEDENYARSIKTKKDHSHLAKIRVGGTY